MDIALGKFFLDALKELRDVFTKARDRSENLVTVGTFLELYGSATRLEGYARRIKLARESKKAASIIDSLKAFFEEVHSFGEVLRKANLSAIDIFHPELGAELARLVEADGSLQGAYERSVAPRYKIKSGQLKQVVDLYVKHYGGYYNGHWNAEYQMRNQLPRWGDPEAEWESASVWEQFEEVAMRLSEFRSIIAEVIRQTWDFKELATLPTKGGAA